jgi:CRISPR/Cas system-associated protein endoribonuclease Cas2
MEPTIEERKVIDAGLKRVRARGEFDKKLQREIRSDLIRRRKIAARFRAQLFKKAFSAAGIDQAEILKRQKSENQAALKRIAELRPQVSKNALVIAKRQAGEIELLKQRAKRLGRIPIHHGQPAPQPLPTEGILLDIATDIVVDGGTGTKTSFGTPWYNLVQTNLVGNTETIGGSYSNGFNCSYCFVYVPDRPGVLHAWSWVIPNGSFSWETDFTCDGGASVWCGMQANMSLQQTSPGGVSNYVYVPGDTPTLFSKSIGLDQHCLGDFGYEVIDSDDTVALETTMMEMTAIAGIPVLIVVDVAVEVMGSDGMCTLDFSEPGQQINVPAVILQLY